MLDLHIAATLFMTGVIWFVQLPHYPLFGDVGEDSFRRYHAEHTRRTTWVVFPPMAIELVTAILLVVKDPTMLRLVGLGLVLLIWGSTAGLQVPDHQRLAKGLDVSIVRRLVMTNWLRTVAWSVRSAICLYWMYLYR